MEVYVENVKIQLTDEQIDLVLKARRARQRCINSFSKVLKHFGFVPSPGNKDCFEHKENDWWAEILDRGTYREVWIKGRGLKSIRTIPGGWIYGSPNEVEKEILNFYESNN